MSPGYIGSYQVEEELGRGGMAVVYRGRDPGIGRPVAIKIIRADPYASSQELEELRLRFRREASAAGRLSHPNIVTIHQLGEHNGAPFMVMELIPGVSLDRLTADCRDSRVPAVEILRQAAAALDYAHAQGIVHRDVKPSNIMVRPDGLVKLTDFGIARIAAQTVTGTGATLGTPAYMSPEQIMGCKVDGRSDQFSLSIVAFRLLAGRMPFDAPSDHALMFKIVSEEPFALEAIRPMYPTAAGEVLRKSLAKKPEDRYASCSEFVEALDRALSKPGVAAAPVASEIPEREMQANAEPPVPVQSPKGNRSRRSSFERWLSVLRWTARIVGSAVAVLDLVVIALVCLPGNNVPAYAPALLLAALYEAALLLAWKWELFGGLASLAVIEYYIWTHLRADDIPIVWITVIPAIPSLLFLCHWGLRRLLVSGPALPAKKPRGRRWMVAGVAAILVMQLGAIMLKARRDAYRASLMTAMQGRQPGVSTTDPEIEAYYNAHKARFYAAEPATRLAQIVVFRGSDTSSASQARVKVAEVQARLARGEDFSTLARTFSEDPKSASAGGDLGWMTASALQKTLPDVAKVPPMLVSFDYAQLSAVPVGGITPLLSSPNGDRTMIMKVLARRPAGQLPLSDPTVQAAIRDALYRQKQAPLNGHGGIH